ncbi:hypothetical protein BDA99DRAFT_469917 [Phascolomyces articulosus]|uniref:Helitron helicase-like domain-containing protein n=1 Tax=Phascolomyces articulosus TaxID=60185 RepID=A0AAD5P9K2_9FUNG|nr:hypothetical protein BDA99DRAFT_469917 [Phascolomyces articulosus]
MTAQCGACGTRVWLWEARRDYANHTYIYSICCGYGVVEIPLLSCLPDPLNSLLTGTDQQSSLFREKLRLYNGVFAFASLGVDNIDERYLDARGTYCFRIQGTVYHNIGSNHPPNDQPPRFAQIYIYDPQEQAAIRQSIFTGASLDHALLLDLQTMLEEHNRHAQTFRIAADHLRGTPKVNLNIRISGDQRRGRQYAAPTAYEIAVLIVDNPGEEPTNRDIVLFRHDGRMERINETKSLYGPLHYVLMLPHGETGWREGIPLRGQQNMPNNADRQRHGRQDTVSVRPFYAHRLQQRNQSQLHLRMHYYRTNQRNLRVERYNGITDALEHDVGENGEIAKSPGRRVILSSSHTGSPRYVKLFKMAVFRVIVFR